MSMLSDFKVGLWERCGCGLESVLKKHKAPKDVHRDGDMSVASVVSEVVVVAAVVKMEDAPLDVTTRQLG
uniref:Uncharacterized protein n=1 Tax=Tanacetum cinerariifolium TaxID=118510 RepID=A0A699JPR3_TANCI|nr:hypothetical protein [Tanacetum cinerariifolium]